ncbi:TonB-dependent receptor [Novosphingobium sp. 1949]|uniref:TonB-dependent receptor n=1 Tax=Novosphingobium organovorum TaxID=2930092 RepID=A0ABT0BJA0_9SPHN|nr:TonB-dependent receptor [Novosphingobium organovorum]MCJ2185025.1 TonB-dependent receptor [Novosphingobium organovorum]
MKTTLKKAALCSATSLTVFAALGSTSAYAQDSITDTAASAQSADAEPSGAIIVTGSRIQRRNLESAAPIAVVDSEEFTLSGAVNVENVINTLPQVIPGTTAFSNNPGGGVSTLDLRGLGAKRTMVLVNGRRWMFYDTDQVVDLNTIPAFLIKDVQAVTGGASAVYGSDALAGVVNFTLKNVDGIEGGAQYNLTNEGDGQRYEAYIAAGGEFADGKGHATVYAEYYNRKSILQGDRSFSDTVLSDDGDGGFTAGGSSTVPYGRFTSTSSSCPSGNVFCSPGAVFKTPGTGTTRTSSDLYNYGPDNYLMVPQERYLMGGYADYEVADGQTAYTEVTFVHNIVRNRLAATPVTGTFNYDIATVGQFLDSATLADLTALDTDGDGVVALTTQRRVTDGSARLSVDERNAFRVLVGMRGGITNAINYDAYYMYSRTRNSNIQYGNISRSAFQAGLDGTADAINIFGELRIPVMANQPGVYRLEIGGAARYSDYSLGAVGGVWAYAGSIEYAPIPDVTFRGQYQRAVRAPNVSELFGGQSQGFPTAVDPCALASAASDSTIYNLCVATGVPGALVGDSSVQINTQIQGLFGGNPDLQEETSDSWTAGVVFTPTFIPGLSVTLDWYKIKVDGYISTLGGGLANTLNLCYNEIQDINSQYCQAFVGTRNALGQMDGENPPSILNANTGALEVEGIDFELNYTKDLDFGLMGQTSKLNFSFQGTYNMHYIYTPVAELPDTTYECAGYFGALVCDDPIAQWKWVSRLTWQDGPLTTSFRWRHLSAVRDDDPSTDYTVERIGAYDLFDLTFGFDVTEEVTLNFGMNNLFNKKPPLMGDNQEQANTYPSTYDVLGRDFFVSAKFHF